MNDRTKRARGASVAVWRHAASRTAIFPIGYRYIVCVNSTITGAFDLKDISRDAQGVDSTLSRSRRDAAAADDDDDDERHGDAGAKTETSVAPAIDRARVVRRVRCGDARVVHRGSFAIYERQRLENRRG